MALKGWNKEPDEYKWPTGVTYPRLIPSKFLTLLSSEQRDAWKDVTSLRRGVSVIRSWLKFPLAHISCKGRCQKLVEEWKEQKHQYKDKGYSSNTYILAHSCGTWVRSYTQMPINPLHFSLHLQKEVNYCHWQESKNRHNNCSQQQILLKGDSLSLFVTRSYLICTYVHISHLANYQIIK